MPGLQICVRFLRMSYPLYRNALSTHSPQGCLELRLGHRLRILGLENRGGGGDGERERATVIHRAGGVARAVTAYQGRDG